MISYPTFANALQKVGRKPNSSQKLAVEAAKDEALFVVAGPGTGKTGKVISSWEKNSSHQPTCEACDSKTYCPDYGAIKCPRVPGVN